MNIKKIPPIKTPLLNYPGVGKGFGIADYHFNECDYIELTCPYRGYDRQQVYPYVYRISTLKRKDYKSMTREGIKIRLIPIAEFEVIK